MPKTLLLDELIWWPSGHVRRSGFLAVVQAGMLVAAFTEPSRHARDVEHAFDTAGVGSNKRYAEGLQRKRFNRESEAHALVPRSLSEAERGDDPVTRGPATPVKVWIDYGNASAQVLGSAVAWTRRAVYVIWTDSHDQRQEAWVWAGAVERLSN